MDSEKVLKLLCEKYPRITMTEGVIGGEPALAGTRMPVSCVLTDIVLYGGILEALKQRDNRYTVDDYKDAIRFTRDFLDMAYRYDENSKDSQ